MKMSSDAKKLPVIFIGAGNLATHLAKAMYQNGFEILQVYSRTQESARQLAENINSPWVTRLQDVYSREAMYIVSLKDSALIELLPQIIHGRESSLLVHTAGSIPMDIWKEGGAKRYGVLYPLQTFSKQQELNFREIPFFIEGSSPAEEQKLKQVASQLSDKVFIANSEKRRFLHLSAVFACNFTNHMYGLAADLLEKCQLPFDVLLPLIDETAHKVHSLSPTQAQTGPAVRYDQNVITKHLEMLSDEPSVQDIYRLLTQSIYNHQSGVSIKIND